VRGCSLDLFDKLMGDSESEKTKETLQTFEPTIIDSQDVVRELKNVAT